MPATEPGGHFLHRHRASYRNAPLLIDNPGLIAGAYLDPIPVLNGKIDAGPDAALPANELALEARAAAWIAAGQERVTWP